MDKSQRSWSLLIFVGVALVAFLFLRPLRKPRSGEIDVGMDSPRMARLATALRSGDRSALNQFWDEVAGHAPIVEPIADDPTYARVTFIWRGDQNTRNVGLIGGRTAGVGAALARLGETDVWYRTERIPSDARFRYSFQVNRADRKPDDLAGIIKWTEAAPLQIDPLNPNNTPGRLPNSPLEMPGAAPQPWLLLNASIPHGVVSKHTIDSSILQQSREFSIYLPPGYDGGNEGGADTWPMLVLFDGMCFIEKEWIPVPTILDNLLAEKKVAPLIVVFVHQSKERNKELACSEPFANYVATELVPWVRNRYRASPDPAETSIGGLSMGGLMASFCALHHSDVFGNVLSLSGSYSWFHGLFEGQSPAREDEEPGWLTREYVKLPRVAVRFYLAAGRFENGHPISLLADNRRFRDVLLAKGYSAAYLEYNGCHDPLGWRGAFAEGISVIAAPTPARPREK